MKDDFSLTRPSVGLCKESALIISLKFENFTPGYFVELLSLSGTTNYLDTDGQTINFIGKISLDGL